MEPLGALQRAFSKGILNYTNGCNFPCLFNPTDQESFATFTYYPIVQHTHTAEERESSADLGAEGLATIGGGMRRQSAASGFSLPSALEPKTRIVRAGGYEDILMTCDIKTHLQMNVKVGVLLNMTEGANGMMDATGTLQLLDLMPVCGNTMLVLRQPRLETPCIFDAVGWPCSSDEICAISGKR